MKALAGLGFNEVPLNIAWGSRPFGEPLNLLDVITVPGGQEQPGTQTNIARMLREDVAAGRPRMPRLVEEMRRLLAADVENQSGKGRVVEMEFQKDPAEFVRTHLLPTDRRLLEKGHFSLTTRQAL